MRKKLILLLTSIAFGVASCSAATFRSYKDVKASANVPVPASTQTQVDIRTYGAVAGDSTFDSSFAINKAIMVADSLNESVLIPPGEFYIVHQVFLGNAPLEGVSGRSRIVAAKHFAFKSTVMGQDVACISNLHFSLRHDDRVAETISISNISFEMHTTFVPANGEAKILALANTKKGEISNCSFRVLGGLGINATCVDVYAADQNIHFENCVFQNFNQAPIGGDMWVRNVAGFKKDSYDEKDDTQNISIDKCFFEEASRDEALSIFASWGAVRRIKITECTFSSLPSNTPHDVLVSVFPMNVGNRPFVAVSDVTFDGCTFKDSNFNKYVFRSGSYSKDKPCGGITVENSTFLISRNGTSAPGTSAYIAKNLFSNGEANTFKNNKIISSGNSVEVAVEGFDSAHDNQVSGNIKKMFNNNKNTGNNIVH